MSTNRFGLSRVTAGLAALSLVLSTGPVPAGAAVTAKAGSISGRIFLSDAKTPVRDAVVKAFNPDNEMTFQSSVTGPDGAYSIEGMAPGEYDLGISTAAGIYEVETRIDISAGRRRAASFALQPYTQEQGEAQQASPDDQKKTEEGQQEPDQQSGKQKRLKRSRSTSSRMRSPWIVTGILVGGAVVIGALSSGHNDSNGSPNR